MSYQYLNNANQGDDEMTSTPKMSIVWTVLEAAKDANDAVVIAACRRLIEANRLGWKKYAKVADYNMVVEFYA